ncbi:MAG: DUF86 domain-containing protein [Bacteroides sp.]|nr:DUF86 domain-containing protein [Bacteroides sp.]
MSKKIKDILEHIDYYCSEISNSQKRYGEILDNFLSDRDYQRSVCMCLIQIGELVRLIPEDFRGENTEIPWKQVSGLRNIVVHAYGEVDFESIFDIMSSDIPILSRFCRKWLKEE